MPAFPKEAIKEILDSLDHTNDALWTDDGSPMVAEIQRLANDKTITRAQINEASPGFARKTKESIPEEVQPSDEGNETGGIDPGPLCDPATALGEDDLDFTDLTPEQDQQRLRAIALARVQDAELAVSDAKEAVADAQRRVVLAEQRHTRALILFSSKFPAMSASENIQQHLARQHEILRERVTGSRFEPNAPQNPIDLRLMDRKRDNGRNKQGQTPAKFLPRSLAVGG